MRKPYKTDLTDDQWHIVKPLIPPAKHGGRPREVNCTRPAPAASGSCSRKAMIRGELASIGLNPSL